MDLGSTATLFQKKGLSTPHKANCRKIIGLYSFSIESIMQTAF